MENIISHISHISQSGQFTLLHPLHNVLHHVRTHVFQQLLGRMSGSNGEQFAKVVHKGGVVGMGLAGHDFGIPQKVSPFDKEQGL